MHNKRLFSELLQGFTAKCSVCGTLMTSTGYMHYSEVMSEWFIEYWCPVDQEIISFFSQDKKKITEDIAEQHPDNEE